MPKWRKRLFFILVLAQLVVAIIFWGSVLSGILIFTCIQSFSVWLFGRYASNDLAKTFEETGKHVQGWRQ